MKFLFHEKENIYFMKYLFMQSGFVCKSYKWAHLVLSVRHFVFSCHNLNKEIRVSWMWYNDLLLFLILVFNFYVFS